jgi:hypothetical protein
MLLVCGGLDRAGQLEDGNIPSYPPVIAVVDEDDTAKLPIIMGTISHPFVVRLCDKDLGKIVNSRAGKQALKNE